jgi:hypothetical protein
VVRKAGLVRRAYPSPFFYDDPERPILGNGTGSFHREEFFSGDLPFEKYCQTPDFFGGKFWGKRLKLI